MSEEKKTISINDEIHTLGEGVKKVGEVTEPSKSAESGSIDIMKWLNSDSPNKELDTYTAHPLNYDNQESTSRIIRGTEGLLGNLNKAFLDIAIGIIQKVSKMFEDKKQQDGRTG